MKVRGSTMASAIAAGMTLLEEDAQRYIDAAQASTVLQLGMK